MAMCIFCLREVPTNQHHIVPKSKGGRKTVPTCRDCEDFIHRTLTHKELRDRFPTVESMQAYEPYRRFLAWLRKQQPTARFRTARNRERDSAKYR
jgi:HNH endonuclease